MNFLDYFIATLFLLGSCNNKHGVEAKTSEIEVVSNFQKEGIVSPEQTSTFCIDSAFVDSLLYFGKAKIMEKSTGQFSFDFSFDRQEQKITVTSKPKIILKSRIEYNVYFKSKKVKESIQEFDVTNEADYEYLGSRIRIGNCSAELTDLLFTNDSTSKVYPGGLWHWSTNGSALKHYKYEGREYFLFNAAELYCNGNHCRSFQVFLIVKEGVKICATNALYFKGTLEYLFNDIHLVDIDRDGYPEIYVPKNTSDSLTSLNDFEVYSFNEVGVLKRRLL